MASNNSFAHTPQAKDDAFTSAATGIEENSTTTFILNVMGNDSAGNAKSMYSLDDGVSPGGASPVDLLTADVVGVTATSALGAMISITADGKVAYAMTAALRTQMASLKPGQTATDTFTYALQMGNGALSWATATVEIAGLNTAPVVTTAPGAAAGTAAQGAITITGQLSVFDPDAEAPPAWTVPGTTGAYGAFSVDANGVWTYQLDSAAAGFHALAEGETRTDTFVVRATDEFGASVDQTVTLTIVGSNDAPVITNIATALAGSATDGVAGTVTGQLSASDVDHGATLTWSVQGNPAGSYGALSVDASGQWTYLLDLAAASALAQGETHDEHFTVRVIDDKGAWVDQLITITVSGTNDAPVITNTAAALTGNAIDGAAGVVTGQLSASDVDHGATQSWSVQGNPAGAYGSLTICANGQWTYALDSNSAAVRALAEGESHDEVFTVRVTDDKGAGVDQVVTVTVTGSNDAPVATNAAAALAGAATAGANLVTSGQLSAADVDHGATQAWSLVGDATNEFGSMSVDANGKWTFVMDGSAAATLALAANKTHAVSFIVRVADEHGASVDQTVTIMLTGANEAPVASSAPAALAGAVAEDANPSASGQLAVTDVDHGATASWSVAGNPAGAYGSIAVDATGQWHYQLDNAAPAVQALAAGESHDESFTIRATDDQGATVDQLVTITVTGSNDAPLLTNAAQAFSATIVDGAACSVSRQLLAVDPDHGATRAWSVVGNPATPFGTMAVSDSGVWTYTPDRSAAVVRALAEGEVQQESFTLRVTDDHGAQVDQQVLVTLVGSNDAPLALDDSFSATEDTAMVISAAALLANDTDVDSGDGRTISAVSNGAHGTVQLVAGTLTYTPALNYNGSDSFSYTVRDSGGLTSTTSVNVSITPVNDAPVTQPFTLSTANTSLDVLVSGAWLYKSDGNDGFLAAAHPVGLPTTLYRFKVADMNGDGSLDVVGSVGGQAGLQVRTFLNNGNGVFSAAGSVTLPSATVQIEDIEVADFNGDHINDVVVSSGVGVHQILLGGAGGSLALKAGAVGATSPLIAANGVGVADIDADGDFDLTFAANGMFVNYVNNGAGAFTKGTSIGTPTTGSFYADAFYADLDGSGKLDLVGIGGLDITYTYKDSASVRNIIVTTANGTQMLPAAQSSDAAIGDINNDGFADIVISVARNYYSASPPAGQSDMVQLWLNDGHGRFAQAANSLTAKVGGVPVSFTSVHLGDINGDGLLDLAATGYSSGVVTSTAPASFAGPYVWINTGNGFTAAPTMSLSATLTSGTGYVNMQFGDLDGGASGSSEDSVQVFTAAQLLAGAVDVEGDTVSIVSVNPLSANGARLSVVNGAIFYDPTASENLQALGGNDTVLDGFTYYVKDSSGATSSGVANVVVRGVDAGDTVGNLLSNSLTGTSGKDTLIGLEGNDILNALNGNDILIGGDGNDLLNGGTGADLLVGGAGADTLTGNNGADVFLYQSLTDRGATNDTITDFAKGGGGDVLEFTTLLRSFAGYDGSNAITGGFVQFTAAPGGSTMVQVDADGSAGPMVAVPLVILTGVVLGAADTGNFLV